VNGPGSLTAALDRARTLGFLGPGPVDAHAAHAAGFVATVEAALGRAPLSVLDLGSGGGVPGLVLAEAWAGTPVNLVESSRRRAEHLRQAISDLGWADRVVVLEERAEVVAHESQFREDLEVVTARSFAEPAATAEIAAGLVAVGGYLVVSEPPDERAERWPPAELEEIGFSAARSVEQAVGHFVLLEKMAAAPANLPRRVGRPAKRPRW
jgi:16S rRNA (guanine527-N7)-methyltransferase